MPQASRYCLPNKLKKHKDAKLNAFLAFLDGMTGALVHWDLWDGLDEPYLALSREVTRGRVLLESPLWVAMVLWREGDSAVTSLASIPGAGSASAQLAMALGVHRCRVGEIHSAGD